MYNKGLKNKKMGKKIYYFGIIFWSFMLLWAFIQDVSTEDPIWLVVIWMVGMWTAVKSLFSINRPAGARKHNKKYYIACKNVNDFKIKNDVKKQSKQAVKILLLWLVFLLVEGLFYYFNIINEKTIILGTIGIRIFDKLFVLVWCPFGVIMKNRCCTTCRIYGWDQLMLNSTLIFIPSIYSYSLILISMIYFIEWELAVRNHPERFSTVSNAAIRCSNCNEICGRCRKIRKEA